MSSRLNPYLNFPGNTKEAMEFYKSVFGGTLNVNTFGEYGEQDPDLSDKIMHAQLETNNGFTLMASDHPSGDGVTQPATTWRSASAATTPTLSAATGTSCRPAGTFMMPFEKQMWGDTFGMCTDKFGLPWMVNITES